MGSVTLWMKFSGAILCAGAAALLALYGVDGWGWFLFVAVLFALH